jgi:hypothetical protein
VAAAGQPPLSQSVLSLLNSLASLQGTAPP